MVCHYQQHWHLVGVLALQLKLVFLLKLLLSAPSTILNKELLFISLLLNFAVSHLDIQQTDLAKMFPQRFLIMHYLKFLCVVSQQPFLSDDYLSPLSTVLHALLNYFLRPFDVDMLKQNVWLIHSYDITWHYHRLQLDLNDWMKMKIRFSYPHKMYCLFLNQCCI